MKKWFSLMAVFTSALFAIGQDSKDSAKAQQPEFMQHIYYYSSSGNKMVALEKIDAEMKTKMKMGGFGGSSTAYTMSGEKSPTRFSQGGKQEFTIKMSSSMSMAGDPGNMIRLYKFESKGSERISMLQKVGVMGTGASAAMDGIKFNSKETTSGVFMLVPEKPLDPGEYAFINMAFPSGGTDPKKGMKYTAFAFAIDK